MNGLKTSCDTSLGPVEIFVEDDGGESVRIRTPPSTEHVTLELDLSPSRQGGRWKIGSSFYRKPKEPRSAMPAALVTELRELGEIWAAEHPAEFSKAKRRAVGGYIEVIVEDVVGQLQEAIRECRETLLEDDEMILMRSASTRKLITDLAKMLRLNSAGIEAKCEEIRAAGEKLIASIQ